MEEIYQKALKTSLTFIRFRPRSIGEVRDKLLSKGFSPSIAQDVIEFLQENSWLDDARFAQEWVSSRVNSHFLGPYRIRTELSIKRIDPALIESCLNETYQERPLAEWACAWLANKYRNRIDILQSIDKQKLTAQLIRNGYSSQDALRALEIFWEWYRQEE